MMGFGRPSDLSSAWGHLNAKRYLLAIPFREVSQLGKSLLGPRVDMRSDLLVMKTGNRRDRGELPQSSQRRSPIAGIGAVQWCDRQAVRGIRTGDPRLKTDA
jgi:hypothetical protein